MEKKNLEALLSDGMTIKSIAECVGKGETTVRYWMAKFELKPNFSGPRKTWSDEEMKEAIATSFTISDVLNKVGLTVRPGNYPRIRKFIRDNNLDISHMLGRKSGRGGTKSRPIKDILVKNSDYSPSALKKRLLKDGLLVNKCCICGQKEQWNKIPLVMVMDHINGDSRDNRIENLRMLCPNCNSQQDTFCSGQRKYLIDLGANVFEKTVNLSICPVCKENTMVRGARKCQVCREKLSRKVEWPSKEELMQLLKIKSMVAIGKQYGVTDNAVRRWTKKYKII